MTLPIWQRIAGFLIGNAEVLRKPDRLEEMLTAFEAFKKEALKRKKAVKEKTASPKEFTDWLYQQSNIIINLSVY